MKQVDAAVIGGGVLGCFVARNLRRWNISTLLIEREDDVCRGITRANTAIVYAGYDNKPGSLKAKMTVDGNADFDRLCRELEVPFHRCGSLMTATGEKGLKTLQKKLDHGAANGVPGLRLLTGDEARNLEPMLSGDVIGALYCPTTGTVNPWQLGIAAYENALQNGCEAMLETSVTAIEKTQTGYRLETSRGAVECRMVLNCAGMDADRVHRMAWDSEVQILLDGADFLVLDPHAQKPSRVIFQETESGKGITAVPCVEGNLLLDSPPRPLDVPYAATREGMALIRQNAAALLPELDLSEVIRSFGAVRPNPRAAGRRSIPDYCIEHPAPDFYSLIGIKTPGLTCANELGVYLAQRCADELGAEVNLNFGPRRPAIPQGGGEILCQCEGVTKEAVLEAIRRGARTVDGVKRRVGSGMGRCQGSRCAWAIGKLLEEANGTL